MISNLDFYNDILTLGRNMVSPISDNAFLYYKYRLEGTFYDENKMLVNKIKVIPKRKSDPVFSGNIFIVGDYWNIHGLDLLATNENMNIPLLDSINIKLDYKKLQRNRADWAMNSQFSTFKISMLGFKATGFHTRNFIDYELQKSFPDDYFDKVVLKVEKEANKRDSIYWEKIRPIPLGIKEKTAYFKMDSLETLYSSKPYLDSIDRERNKFAFINLLNGYTHANSFKKRFWSISSPLKNIGFNPVQGFVASLGMSYKTEYSDQKSMELSSGIKYGFSDKEILGHIKFSNRPDKLNNLHYSVSAGRDYFQPSDRELVNGLYNASYAFGYGKSYIQLYDRYFFDFDVSRDLITGLTGKASLKYSHREKLVNHSDFSFAKKTHYKPNIYEETGSLVFNKALKLNIEIKYQPGVKIIDVPDQKINIGSKYPVFRLLYEKALKLGSTYADYDFIRGGISGGFVLGVFDNLNYSFEAGIFIRNKNTDILDDKYFTGNQFILMSSNDFFRAYHLLPFYTRSDFGSYFSASIHQCFKGIIMNKIPLLKKMKSEEILSFKSLLNVGKLPYYEIGIGLNKIFGFINVQYSYGFQGSNYFDQGFRVGLGIPFLNVNL